MTTLTVILVTTVLLHLSVSLHAQTTEVTQEPEEIRSLFTRDTCEPPCWFGLIPGESRAEQVAEFFKSNPELFSEQWPIRINGEINPHTGYLVKGSYSFYWAEDLTPSHFAAPNYVLINDGLFDQLYVRLNKPITLREMLEILGQPEQLRLGLSGYGHVLIGAIYETDRIRILLGSPDRFDDCTFSDVGTSYAVSGMTYFSPDAAQRPVTPGLDQSPQPQLTAYYENDLEVPVEELQKWLNNEETRTCIEVWEHLWETSQMP